MSDIQALFDGWAAQSRLERIESESIMNLGDLIDALSKFDESARVVVNVVATDETPDGTKLMNGASFTLVLSFWRIVASPAAVLYTARKSAGCGLGKPPSSFTSLIEAMACS